MSPHELEQQISLYNTNPWLFSDNLLDEVEKYSSEYDIPFQRNMDVEEQKQGSYLNQFVSGFSEGLLGPLAFGGWAEDPEAPGEQIAHSMGHLIGFAPALLGSIVTGGATGLARLGLGAVQASRSQKVISGLATVGKFLQSPVAKSIPFRVAEPVIKKGLNPLITKAGINVNSYLKKGSIGADIYESAASLGIASGVSSVWEGTDVALNSVVHGAMFGGAFGTIGNFVNMGKMLGHSNPAVRSGAEKWWFNTVVKGGLGAGLQGGLATAQGAPTAVQMYEYILGGFFGATHPSAKVKAARNYIGSFYDKKGEMYGEKHHGKDLDMLNQEEFSILDKESQDYVKWHYKQHIGQKYDGRMGQLEMFEQEAKEGEEVTEASVQMANLRRKLEQDTEIAEAHLKMKRKTDTLTEEDQALAKGRALKELEDYFNVARDVSVATEVATELSDVKNLPDQLNEKVSELDKRAKQIGFKNSKQLNLNSIQAEEIIRKKGGTEEDITEAKDILKEYSDIGRQAIDLSPSKATLLNKDSQDNWIYRRNRQSFKLDRELDFNDALEMYEFNKRMGKEDVIKSLLEDKIEGSSEARENFLREVDKIDKKIKDPEVKTGLSEKAQEVLDSLSDTQREEIQNGNTKLLFDIVQGREDSLPDAREGIDLKNMERPPDEQQELDIPYKIKDLAKEIFDNNKKDQPDEILQNIVDVFNTSIKKTSSYEEFIDEIRVKHPDYIPSERVERELLGVFNRLQNEQLYPYLYFDTMNMKLGENTRHNRQGKYNANFRPPPSDEIYFKDKLLDERIGKQSNEIEKEWNHWIATKQYSPNAGKDIIRIDIKGFDPVKSKIEFANAKNYIYNENTNEFIDPVSKETVFPRNLKIIEFKEAEFFNEIYKPYDQRWDHNLRERVPVMSGADWYDFQSKLDNGNRYLKIPVKDNGVERVYPYHKNVTALDDPRTGLTDLSALDRMWKTYMKTFRTIDKKADLFFKRDMENWVDELSDNQTVDAPIREKMETLYKKATLSNFLYEPNAQFGNAMKRVKYEGIIASKGMPQKHIEKFRDITPDGTIEFIAIDEMPSGTHTTNTVGIPHEKYRMRTGRDSYVEKLYESEIDGWLTLHTDLYKRLLEVNGFDPSTSRMKPSVAAWIDGRLFIIKAGVHPSHPEYDTAMGAKNRGIVTLAGAKIVPNEEHVYHGKAKKDKNGNLSYEFTKRKKDKDGNWKGTKVKVKNPKTIKINLSDLRLDYGVREDSHALKQQTIKKQFHVLLNQLQVPKEAFDSLMREAFDPIIDGDPVANSVVETLKSNEKAPIPKNFNIKDIGDAQFVYLINNPKHPLYKELLAEMARETSFNEYEDSFGQKEELLEISDYTNRLQRWAKYTYFDPLVAMAEPELYQAMVQRYRKTKFMYPKWKNSAKGWVAGNDPITKLRHGKVKSGTFMLGHSYRGMKIKWLDTNTEVSLEWALLKYQSAKGKEKKLIADTLEMALMRVPSGAVAGTRILRFDGFIENGSKMADHGVYMHPKDHFYIDGADVDGDTVFFYQGLPKAFRDGIKSNANELEIKMKGKLVALPSKDEKANDAFGSTFPDKITEEIFSSRLSQYMPFALRKVGKAAYEGKEAMGTVVNAKTFLNYVTADVVSKPNNGRVKLDVFTDGKKDGFIMLETNKRKLTDPDTGYRKWAVEAGQRTADSSEYWNILPATEIRDLLLEKAFTRAVYIDSKGGQSKIDFKMLQSTKYGDLYNVNEKLFGRNYYSNRPWSIDEVQFAMDNAKSSEYRMNSLFHLANKMASNKIKVKYNKGNKQWRKLITDFNKLLTQDKSIRDYIVREKLQITPVYLQTDYKEVDARMAKFHQDPKNKDLVERNKNTGGQIDFSLLKIMGMKRDKSLDSRYQKLFDKMWRDKVVRPMDPAKEAKLLFNDAMDLYSAIVVSKRGELLVNAMNDAGQSDSAFPFLKEISRLAVQTKVDYNRSRKGNTRRMIPSEQTLQQGNDTLKKRKRAIYKQAKEYGIDEKLALDYFYYYMTSSLYNQTRSSDATRNEIRTWLTNEKKKPERPKIAKDIDKTVKYKNENSIAYWEGVLDNFSKWYNKTSFNRFPLESNEVPERIKRDFMSGFGKTWDMIRSDEPLKAIDRAMAEEMSPEKVKSGEGITPRQREVEAKMELERLLGDKFKDVEPELVEKSQVPDDIPKVMRTLHEDFKKLPPEATLFMEEYFGVYQQESKGFAKPISEATYDDIRGFQKFIRSIRVEGADTSRLKKAYYYLFPDRVGEKQLTFDMSQTYKQYLLYKDKKGRSDLLDIRVPFSTFKYLSESFGQVYTMENIELERNQEDIQRFYNLRDQILGLEDGTTKFAKLHRIAVAKMLRDSGAGTQGSEESQALRQEFYDRIWAEQSAEFESLKGEKYRVTEEGKSIEKTAEEIVDWIGESHGKFLEETYNKWIIATDKTGKTFWSQIDDEHIYKKYDDIIEFLPSGRLNFKRVQKFLLEPAAFGSKDYITNLIEQTSLSAETLYRIQYETMLEARIAELKIKPDSPEATKIRERTRKRFDMDDQGNRVWRNTAFQPIGYVGSNRASRSNAFEYWPQMMHNATRKSRRQVREFISEQLGKVKVEAQRLADDVAENSVISDENYSIKPLFLRTVDGDMTLLRKGEITRETLVDRIVGLQEQAYESFLGNRASEDGGASEHAMAWLLANHTDRGFLRDTMGFNSKPGSGKARGDTPMPGFSLDFDVIEAYSNQWVSSFYKNLTAIVANDRISDFTKNNPLHNKDHLQEWENFMKMYARDVMGYPSVFNEQMIGMNDEELKRVKKDIKTLEAIPDPEISAGQIDEYNRKKELVRKNEQRKKVRKTAYYWLSDEVWSNMLEKVAFKLGGKDTPKLPSFEDSLIPKLKELPKTEQARKYVLRKTVQSFGAFEAKWSLISLLSHPKTAIGNLMGGNINTISSSGLRHFTKAKSPSHLYSIFKGGKLKDGTEATPENIMTWVNRFAEESGALESFIVSEASLERGFRGKKMKGFLAEFTDELKKDYNMPDQSLYDIAKKHGVNKAVVDAGAWFMRKSERMLRRDSFLTHYLSSRETLSQILPTMEYNNPYLIKMAVKGVEATQFLYHGSARPAFSRTSTGKIFTRFMPFAWNSIKFRRLAWQRAKVHGFDINTLPGQRLQRQLTADLLTFALAQIFVSSIFDSALPPPMSYMQDTADWVFGDEKHRERAFFNQWPHPALAPLSTITGPSMRLILGPTKALINNDWEPFLDYHLWTWAPFGRLARSVVKTYEVPEMWVEQMTGIPIHRVAQKKKKAEKEQEELKNAA